MDCHTGIDDNDTAATACGSELLALSSTPKPQIETSLLSEQLSSPPSVSSASAMSSLISLWQPETPRKSVHFYLHSTEPKDLDFEALKVYSHRVVQSALIYLTLYSY